MKRFLVAVLVMIVVAFALRLMRPPQELPKLLPEDEAAEGEAPASAPAAPVTPAAAPPAEQPPGAPPPPETSASPVPDAERASEEHRRKGDPVFSWAERSTLKSMSGMAWTASDQLDPASDDYDRKIQESARARKGRADPYGFQGRIALRSGELKGMLETLDKSEMRAFMIEARVLSQSGRVLLVPDAVLWEDSRDSAGKAMPAIRLDGFTPPYAGDDPYEAAIHFSTAQFRTPIERALGDQSSASCREVLLVPSFTQYDSQARLASFAGRAYCRQTRQKLLAFGQFLLTQAR